MIKKFHYHKKGQREKTSEKKKDIQNIIVGVSIGMKGKES